MCFVNPTFRVRLTLIIAAVLFNTLTAGALSFPDVSRPAGENADTSGIRPAISNFLLMLESDKLDNADAAARRIERILGDGRIEDHLVLSDGYYALGIYMLKYSLDYSKAVKFLDLSARYREEAGIMDSRYTKCLNNLGSSWYNLGDYSKSLSYGEKSLMAKRMIGGSDSVSLVSNYLNLASINLQLYNFDEALRYAEAGIAISRLSPGKIDPSTLASLYQDIAIGLYRKDENAKALVYAKQALALYEPGGVSLNDSWGHIIITITLIYDKLNMPEKAEEYYQLGLKNTTSSNIRNNYLLVTNYADFLVRRNDIEGAEKVLVKYLGLIRSILGTDSQEFSLTNAFYSSVLYLRDNNAGTIGQNFSQSFVYTTGHPWDKLTHYYVLQEYGKTLYKAGRYSEAISVFDMIIKPEGTMQADGADYREDGLHNGYLSGPLSWKYLSLNALAKETGSKDYIMQAIETGEMLVSIIDRNRVEMSEEESRIKLSGDTRLFYTGLIENYCSLYKSTGNKLYLEKAFEMSEKSKVSGFLAATRQVNATRFSVPEKLSKIDYDLRKKIGLYKEFMAKEEAQEQPDSNKMAILERTTFSLIRSRDSLVNIFEENYPEFYKLRYNSAIASLSDVPGVIGHDENLLSYVISSDRLFIFVVNRKNRMVIEKDIDTLFLKQLERFRHILSTMPDTKNARASFDEYMGLANNLYNVLLRPAEPFLISNRLTISPDNILSYLPFETLVTSPFTSDGILYRDAPYVIKKYRLSYIYSVTLSSETERFILHLRNQAVAFAPNYANRELSDSLLNQYPDLRGSVSGLPYAVEEATDVVRLCGGVAYIGQSATEEMFKREASKFNIIHLAMHTLVNDQDPSYSKMIFSRSPGSSEDDLLNTYEVYNIPLDARMVVLSSCNTGSGKLTSGEGIQSLARGFIFSGSQSVVMSMWEVEDYAGYEVVKLFYKNIINGKSKSQALRSARLKFLEGADQQRSHPYYWSTLVVYGDDSPLYFSKLRAIGASLCVIMALALILYLIYRTPRS